MKYAERTKSTFFAYLSCTLEKKDRLVFLSRLLNASSKWNVDLGIKNWQPNKLISEISEVNMKQRSAYFIVLFILTFKSFLSFGADQVDFNKECELAEKRYNKFAKGLNENGEIVGLLKTNAHDFPFILSDLREDPSSCFGFTARLFFSSVGIKAHGEIRFLYNYYLNYSVLDHIQYGYNPIEGLKSSGIFSGSRQHSPPLENEFSNINAVSMTNHALDKTVFLALDSKIGELLLSKNSQAPVSGDFAKMESLHNWWLISTSGMKVQLKKVSEDLQRNTSYYEGYFYKLSLRAKQHGKNVESMLFSKPGIKLTWYPEHSQFIFEPLGIMKNNSTNELSVHYMSSDWSFPFIKTSKPNFTGVAFTERAVETLDRMPAGWCEIIVNGNCTYSHEAKPGFFLVQDKLDAMEGLKRK